LQDPNLEGREREREKERYIKRERDRETRKKNKIRNKTFYQILFILHYTATATYHLDDS
jgi:hypothetical protein